MKKNTQNMNVGYIGLGVMGRAMAGHLLAAGYRVYSVKHRSPTPSALIEAGLQIVPSLTDVAKHCSVIFLNLPDTPDVARVIFGDEQNREALIHALQKGTIIVDNSTISPDATREFAKKLHTQGAFFVDAPVSGGETGAINATLTIMVGADKAAFHKVKPLLQCLGKTITRIGEAGAGQVCKATNQIVVAGTIAVVAEALVFARKNGADPILVREALMGGSAGSKIMEIQGKRMLEGAFAPGFRLSLHRKDLAIVKENAVKNDAPIPITDFVQTFFNACKDMGYDDKDSAILVKVYEIMAKTNLTRH